MATSPFSEASYCKVIVPRLTHKRGRQGVAHDREPVGRAAFRGSDGLEPPKSVTVREFPWQRETSVPNADVWPGLAPPRLPWCLFVPFAPVVGAWPSPVAGGRDAGAFCEVPHDAMRMTVDRGDR